MCRHTGGGCLRISIRFSDRCHPVSRSRVIHACSPNFVYALYETKPRAVRKDKPAVANAADIFIQFIHKPERKVICKRGAKAEDYFSCCDEVGCDV